MSTTSKFHASQSSATSTLYQLSMLVLESFGTTLILSSARITTPQLLMHYNAHIMLSLNRRSPI
uniref:Ovule protein n=1 Tax=Heterorhabditis bacteriophora TaxID=37862 RepID=A0A1I7XKJ6_HETBA